MPSETHVDHPEIMWHPKPGTGRPAQELRDKIQSKYQVEINDYWDFHKWSIENIPEFWAEMWDFAGIVYSKTYDKVVDRGAKCEDMPVWFQGALLNYAENILKYRGDHTALIVAGEERPPKYVSHNRMYEEACLYGAALRKFGVKEGDCIACYMSNREEPIYAMLGVISIGALWTGALPLLGAQAALNRFNVIHPKILFTVDRFKNDGEEIEMLEKLKEISNELSSLERVVIVPSTPESRLKDISGIRNSCFLEEFLKLGRKEDGTVPPLKFEQLPFNHPVFISYTSGTTGPPKALIHGSEGLLSAARDIWLHNDSKRETIFLSTSPFTSKGKAIPVFYGDLLSKEASTPTGVSTVIVSIIRNFAYTSVYKVTSEKVVTSTVQVGWSSWNTFTTFMSLGSTVVVFEGVPFFVSPTYFWDMVDTFKINNLFLTPHVLDELQRRNYLPSPANHLSSLEMIYSSSSVVKPQNYDFVYGKIKSDVKFGSCYGSTEIMGGTILFEHSLPIYKGEITAPSLGSDVKCLNDSGEPLLGEIGEMVLTSPTPTLPLGLWGDKHDTKHRVVYCRKFPGHFFTGDLCLINPVTKGYIMCGRSDGTLKQRGARIGGSEIYNVVEIFEEICNSLCVSQYNKDGDERAILFLKMSDGYEFNEELVKKIRSAIENELTKRHVPEIILEAKDIPMNMNGKKMEILVKKIVNKMPYNSETVINPESLEYYKNVYIQGF